MKQYGRPAECFLEIEQLHREEAYVVKAAPSEENIVLDGRNESKEYIKKRSNAQKKGVTINIFIIKHVKKQTKGQGEFK